MRHALFTGTFDPPTWGHLNIIQRAVPLFDQLKLAVGHDSRKEPPLLSVQERMRLLKELTSLEVVEIKGLLADYVKNNGITMLVRALRSAEDVHHELSMAEANRQLCGVETVLLMGEANYAYISSSLVREIARLGGSLDSFVPPAVALAVKNTILMA